MISDHIVLQIKVSYTVQCININTIHNIITIVNFIISCNKQNIIPGKMLSRYGKTLSFMFKNFYPPTHQSLAKSPTDLPAVKTRNGPVSVSLVIKPADCEPVC